VRRTACRICLAARSSLALHIALHEVIASLETAVSVAGYTGVADLDTTRHTSSGVDVVRSDPIFGTNKPLFTQLFRFPYSIHSYPFSFSKRLLPRSTATSMSLSARDGLPAPIEILSARD
jgi:hypothetical protein